METSMNAHSKSVDQFTRCGWLKLGLRDGGCVMSNIEQEGNRTFCVIRVDGTVKYFETRDEAFTGDIARAPSFGGLDREVRQELPDEIEAELVGLGLSEDQDLVVSRILAELLGRRGPEDRV